MLVGRSYILTFSAPFTSINNQEVVLDAITSARTLVDYGIDVYGAIFESVGLTREDYTTWLTGDKLIYTFRLGEVIYKVPNGHFTTAPEIQTVDYRQAAIVVELPYLTGAESTLISDTLDDIVAFYKANHGLEVTPVLKSYGKTKAIPDADAGAIQTVRMTRRNEAVLARPTVESLQRTVLDYQVKLSGLEAIIIDQGIRV